MLSDSVSGHHILKHLAALSGNQKISVSGQRNMSRIRRVDDHAFDLIGSVARRLLDFP